MVAMRSPAFVRAEHPDLGPVVFTPGELLAPWVLAALDAGARLVATGQENVMVLELSAKAAAAASKATP